MNAERRKAIRATINKVSAFKDAFLTVAPPDDLKEDIESIQAEESDFFEGMPESMKGGAKGTEAEERIEHLSSAIEELEGLMDTLADVEAKCDEVISCLESAAQ